MFVYNEEEQRVVPYEGQGRLSRMSRMSGSLSRTTSLERGLSISTPDLTKSSSSFFRTPSPSVSSQDISGLEVDSKIKELENVIEHQKTTIEKQNQDIKEHKSIIKKLERAVQHLYKEDYNLEDID